MIEPAAPHELATWVKILAWLKANKLEMHTPKIVTQTYVKPRRRRLAHWGKVE